MASAKENSKDVKTPRVTPTLGKYMLVARDDQGKWADVPETPDAGNSMDSTTDVKAMLKMPLAPHRLKIAMQGGKGRANKPILVKLVRNDVTVGAAATPVSTVITLNPATATDYSGFAALYDEARVTHIDLKFRIGGGTAINGSADAAVAWDPANAGAYASVDDVLTSQHKLGPLAITSQTFATSSLAVTQSGYHQLHIKPHPQKVTVDTVAAVVGGSWFGTSSAAPVVGYLKPYCQSFGAANAATLVYWITYTVEFRNRT
jgi:hypothetical protein